MENLEQILDEVANPSISIRAFAEQRLNNLMNCRKNNN